MDNVILRDVLKQMSSSIPEEIHRNIIIVGSLAAAYSLFKGKKQIAVRTKDVDCVLSPFVSAVANGKLVAKKLLENGWKQKEDKNFVIPGKPDTPTDKLPALRLIPPGKGSDWFLELLTAPSAGEAMPEKWTRIPLDPDSHFGLPTFTYLNIATFDPIQSEFGIRIARPEMMALANLLENPTIRSDLIADTSIKRSNKDLGRVLTIVALTSEETWATWPEKWERALNECFPTQLEELKKLSGAGLKELLSSPEDLEQAINTCNTGLMASQPVYKEQITDVGNRFIKYVIDEFTQSWQINENDQVNRDF